MNEEPKPKNNINYQKELDKVIQGIKDALNDEANGYPYSAESQIKKYFPEV